MKAKSKLIISLSMLVFVCFALVAGVFAVTTLNFNIGGSIKFTAKGINATISKGTLSATGSHVTSTDSTNKMKQIVLSTTTEDPNHSTNVASWAGLNLLFNENGDDVTISFSIKNDAKTGSTETVYTKITTSAGAGATNATISASPETASIAPQATQNFVITFHITEPSLNAELPNFAITVELALTPFQTTPASLSFDDYATGVNTVAVSGSDKSVTSVAIPETIEKDGTTYTVITIKASAFSNCSNLEQVTIPATITTIEANAFAGCTNLSNITFENTANWHISMSADSTYGTEITPTLQNITSTYSSFYIKSGTYTQAKTLTITASGFVDDFAGVSRFYIQYIEGMTWTEFIENTVLNKVLNNLNDSVGQFSAVRSTAYYIDENHTGTSTSEPFRDYREIDLSSTIDGSIDYLLYRGVMGMGEYIVLYSPDPN